MFFFSIMHTLHLPYFAHYPIICQVIISHNTNSFCVDIFPAFFNLPIPKIPKTHEICITLYYKRGYGKHVHK